MQLAKFIIKQRIILFAFLLMLRYSFCMGFVVQGNNLETNLNLATKYPNIQDKLINIYGPIWDAKDNISSEPINLQLRYYSEYIDLLGKLALNKTLSINEKKEYYIEIRNIGIFAADIINAYGDTTAINYQLIEKIHFSIIDAGFCMEDRSTCDKDIRSMPYIRYNISKRIINNWFKILLYQANNYKNRDLNVNYIVKKIGDNNTTMRNWATFRKFLRELLNNSPYDNSLFSMKSDVDDIFREAKIDFDQELNLIIYIEENEIKCGYDQSTIRLLVKNPDKIAYSLADSSFLTIFGKKINIAVSELTGYSHEIIRDDIELKAVVTEKDIPIKIKLFPANSYNAKAILNFDTIIFGKRTKEKEVPVKNEISFQALLVDGFIGAFIFSLIIQLLRVLNHKYNRLKDYLYMLLLSELSFIIVLLIYKAKLFTIIHIDFTINDWCGGIILGFFASYFMQSSIFGKWLEEKVDKLCVTPN